MLIEANNKTHRKSRYKCDRCGVEIESKSCRHTLYHQLSNENYRKYCDLCEKCFRAFERGMKKGKKNENRETY